jgi:hypothetical protein
MANHRSTAQSSARLARIGHGLSIPDLACEVQTYPANAIRTHTELVLVDEIHNLNLATRSGAEVSDQLKYFAVRYLQLWGCMSR